jgi:hypothetical protein
MSKVELLISRNFKCQSLPKAIDLPDQTKEAYIQWLGKVVALIAKPEGRIQRRRTSLETDIHPQPTFVSPKQTA